MEDGRSGSPQTVQGGAGGGGFLEGGLGRGLSGSATTRCCSSCIGGGGCGAFLKGGGGGAFLKGGGPSGGGLVEEEACECGLRVGGGPTGGGGGARLKGGEPAGGGLEEEAAWWWETKDAGSPGGGGGTGGRARCPTH